MLSKLRIAAVFLFVGVFLATPAYGQEPDPVASLDAVVDNLWIVIAGILVFLMQAGFAFVEAGLTRAKNVANIMAKNLADVTIGVLVFFFVGFSLAFGEGGNSVWGWGNSFIGASQETFTATGEDLSPATVFFFQAMFAAAAVTIVSGAIAGRAKFSTYILFGIVMTGLIYPLVVHWTWGGGFISEITIGDAAYSDFAGSTIVHSVGGFAALMGALIIGPRIGKYGKDGKPKAMPGHSMPFVVIGVFILWFGWFGFNAGSELAADNLISYLALNTALAAAAGVVGASALTWLKTGKPDVGMAGNGALAGLVSITAGVGTITPFGAVCVGFIGGIIVVGSVLFFERVKIDDPVGAISVHGVCGVWGTLAIGFFAVNPDAFVESVAGDEYSPSGLFYGGDLDQLLVQALFVLIVAAWVIPTSGALFLALKYTVGLRVSETEELAGLDVIEHGAPGYSITLPAGIVPEADPQVILQPSEKEVILPSDTAIA